MKRIVKIAFVFAIIIVLFNLSSMVAARAEARAIWIRTIEGELQFDNLVTSPINRDMVLYNLELFPVKHNNTIWLDDFDSENAIRRLRSYLLRFGFANLLDDAYATPDEITDRDYAYSNRNGYWDTLLEPTLLDTLFSYTPTVIGILGAFGVFSYVYKRLKTRKLVVFIGGDIASGKTTLNVALADPYITEGDLLSQRPTAAVASSRVIRDDKNVRLTLDLRLMDYPGDHYHIVLDAFNKNNNVIKNFVVILVVSPIQSNTIRNSVDNNYIFEQLSTIRKLWVPLFNASTMSKPRKVILFVNKSDLYDDFGAFQTYLSNHVGEIKTACTRNNINCEVIYGSVVKRIGLQRVNLILQTR